MNRQPLEAKDKMKREFSKIRMDCMIKKTLQQKTKSALWSANLKAEKKIIKTEK